jgi:hypothetical protein
MTGREEPKRVSKGKREGGQFAPDNKGKVGGIMKKPTPTPPKKVLEERAKRSIPVVSPVSIHKTSIDTALDLFETLLGKKPLFSERNDKGNPYGIGRQDLVLVGKDEFTYAPISIQNTYLNPYQVVKGKTSHFIELAKLTRNEDYIQGIENLGEILDMKPEVLSKVFVSDRRERLNRQMTLGNPERFGITIIGPVNAHATVYTNVGDTTIDDEYLYIYQREELKKAIADGLIENGVNRGGRLVGSDDSFGVKIALPKWRFKKIGATWGYIGDGEPSAEIDKAIEYLFRS